MKEEPIENLEEEEEESWEDYYNIIRNEIC